MWVLRKTKKSYSSSHTSGSALSAIGEGEEALE
jgi:hypothetical protein